MPLPLIPADKANHFAYGAGFYLTGAAGAALLHLPYAPHAAGACVCLAAALGKEALDWLGNRQARVRGEPPPHGVEAADAGATALGGLFCALAARLG